MTLVYNYNNDMAAIVFISELQVSHFFYKYLVKYKVIRMRDILSRDQKYKQIEDATQSKISRSTNWGNEGEK